MPPPRPSFVVSSTSDVKILVHPVCIRGKARRDQYKARKFRKLAAESKLPPSVLEAYERAKNTPNPRSSVTAIINSALERTESKHGARVMLDNQRYEEARVRPPTYLSSESE